MNTISAASRQLTAVAGESNPVFDFRALPEAPGCQGAPQKARGRLRDVAAMLARWNAAGCGVFFTPAQTDGRGVRRDNIRAARALILDLDGTPLPRDWRITPHIIVETSPGKFQCAWALEPTSDLAAAEDLSRRLAAYYSGDRAVCDAAHVFRLAGFLHQKAAPFRSRIVHAADPEALQLGSFERLLPGDFAWLPPLPQPERSESTPTTGAPLLDAAKARALLAHLDPAAFAVNATEGDRQWRTLAMALHEASGGNADALAAFQEWCAVDPDYGSEEQQAEIAARWASFGKSTGPRIGAGTLHRLCIEHGVSDLVIGTVFRDPVADFADEPLEPARPDIESGDAFKRHATGPKTGQIVADNQDNIRSALRRLGARVRYNLFSDRVLIEGLDGFGPHLDDAAVDRLWLTIDRKFRFRPSPQFFATVLRDAARLNSFHPVRDYLDRVQKEWDGVPRLDRLLIMYAGAEDTPYVRAVSALPLIAAARRVRKPGAKFDEMPVLESSQGKNKSSALEILAIRPEWFSDSMPLNADGKIVIEATAGKLVMESADLHGLKRADIDSVKAQLSRTVDRARLAYGREAVERPRQFIQVGTANSQDYLRDRTGNRRFWPVKVREFDLAALRRDLDQLWGEAAAREARNESIRLDRALWHEAAREQDKRTDIRTDPFTDAIRNVLGDANGKMSSEDAWCIIGLTTPGHRTQAHNDRMGAAMRYLGWQRRAVKIGRRKVPGYVRGPQPYRRIEVHRDRDDVYVVHPKRVNF